MRTLSRRRNGAWAVGAILVVALGACSADQLVGNAKLPPNISDPALLENPAGAVATYRGALVAFRQAFDNTTAISGLLSDELQTGAIGQPITAWDFRADVDSRVIPELTDPDAFPPSGSIIPTYNLLQTARGQAEEAEGLLIHFGGDSLQALRGHLDALEGYAEVMLADVYCSGIPLSTVDYGGDYTLAAGSTTQAVYQKAIGLFDTALTLSADSARVVDLARVGKGRALLALGQYADAAQAVADVPDGFRYDVFFANQNNTRSFAYLDPAVAGLGPWAYAASDHEGINGLDYRSSNDPRTLVVSVGANRYGSTIYHPTKYANNGGSSIVLASGVEARLIEAEAALAAGDASWLATLNHLRETAIVPALPDTTDPGTPDARISLLFRERAFWLFLTGHRQGDMRRLIRQYGRAVGQVYPIGSYLGGPGAYGGDITIPVPATERAYNNKYTGCINRGA